MNNDDQDIAANILDDNAAAIDVAINIDLPNTSSSQEDETTASQTESSENEESEGEQEEDGGGEGEEEGEEESEGVEEEGDDEEHEEVGNEIVIFGEDEKLDQSSIPHKGDRIVFYDRRIMSWRSVTLLTNAVRVWPHYYNYVDEEGLKERRGEMKMKKRSWTQHHCTVSNYSSFRRLPRWIHYSHC